MLKVLLVDDEPFIVQGLKVLLDWEKEGFEIVGSASDGREALCFLAEYEVDLIIADINMPYMTGLELLQKIRKEKISDAYFMILSGHADFSYAQQAIRYECTDYVLKPVDVDELTSILFKIRRMNENVKAKDETVQAMEYAYLARNMIALISGKYDNQNLDYVNSHMKCEGKISYINIELDRVVNEEELDDQDQRSSQRKIYDACKLFLKEYADRCIFDVSVQGKVYDIGLVFCEDMLELNQSREEYIQGLWGYLQDAVQLPIIVMVGKAVSDMRNIAKSYTSACVFRSFQGFHVRKNIYYYEEDIQVKSVGVVLCKNSVDKLVHTIELNEKEEIIGCVDEFFSEMRKLDVTGKIMNLNINYLLFQLIHLATEQDDAINQEEILHMISESSFEEGVMRGSKDHIARFACEYGTYLAQLRRNTSRGVLGSIEKEIQMRYAENLTLKELSEKYYVNSAYLGQLFRKKYKQSFKDYLNQFRMEMASKQLLRTDDKIIEIAESVGYHDLDYFVNRFIAVKGCTPAKFRKQSRVAK